MYAENDGKNIQKNKKKGRTIAEKKPKKNSPAKLYPPRKWHFLSFHERSGSETRGKERTHRVLFDFGIHLSQNLPEPHQNGEKRPPKIFFSPKQRRSLNSKNLLSAPAPKARARRKFFEKCFPQHILRAVSKSSKDSHGPWGRCGGSVFYGSEDGRKWLLRILRSSAGVA